MVLVSHDSDILAAEALVMISIMSLSYNVCKVYEWHKLRIFCSNTVSIGVSNIDIDIETLVNIRRILKIKLNSNN